MEGCIIWTGAVSDNGYGTVFGGERKAYAHRFIYELVRGPIPEGLQIDHLCRNRRCVNISHLEAVTQRENLRRGDGCPGTNARKTHCPRGHEYTEANTRTRNGMRYCRACDAAMHREKRARERDA